MSPNHWYLFLSFHFSIPNSLPLTLFHPLLFPCFAVRTTVQVQLTARGLCGPLTKCLCPPPDDSSTTGRLKGGEDERGGGSGEEVPVGFLHLVGKVCSFSSSSKVVWAVNIRKQIEQPFEGFYKVNLEKMKRCLTFISTFVLELFLSLFDTLFLSPSRTRHQ